MKTAGTVILVLVLLLLAAAVGWVFFVRSRAQRLGLPPPSLSSFIPFGPSRSTYGVQPAPGGIVGWFNDRLRSLKGRNSRTATGAYEGAGSALGGNRAARAGFGPLDPDDAWDARVNTEADAYYYNEEQELGLHQGGGIGSSAAANSSRLDVSGNTAYLGARGATTGVGAGAASPGALGTGAAGGSTYDMNLAVGGGPDDHARARGRSPGGSNPFDDDAHPSNLSLRGVSPRPMAEEDAGGAGDDHGGPDSPTERKSVFRENV